MDWTLAFGIGHAEDPGEPDKGTSVQQKGAMPEGRGLKWAWDVGEGNTNHIRKEVKGSREMGQWVTTLALSIKWDSPQKPSFS